MVEYGVMVMELSSGDTSFERRARGQKGVTMDVERTAGLPKPGGGTAASRE